MTEALKPDRQQTTKKKACLKKCDAVDFEEIVKPCTQREQRTCREMQNSLNKRKKGEKVE